MLSLSSIWRDLAYWGYVSGVKDSKSVSPSTITLGTEDVRALFTRGVTRVAERKYVIGLILECFSADLSSARRKFAEAEFWVMPVQLETRSFIEAVVLEDAQLSLPDLPEEEEDSVPLWLRTRRRFTKRQMAHLSPRLGLLNNLPMSIPFQTRLMVFRKFVE